MSCERTEAGRVIYNALKDRYTITRDEIEQMVHFGFYRDTDNKDFNDAYQIALENYENSLI